MGTAGGSVTWKPKVKCQNMPHHRGLCMTHQEFLNVSRWQVGPLEVVSSVHFASWKCYPNDTIESRLQGGLLEQDSRWGVWPLSR